MSEIFPCENCICLPICISNYNKETLFSILVHSIKKCSLLKDYMANGIYAIDRYKELEYYSFVRKIYETK